MGYFLRSAAGFGLHVAFPLVLGVLIYVCCRDVSELQAVAWANMGGAFAGIPHLSPPPWVVYNLPDGLWLYSSTYAVLHIWHFQIHLRSLIWLCLPALFAFMSEGLQYLHLLPGTFDINDILTYIISLLPIAGNTKLLSPTS